MNQNKEVCCEKCNRRRGRYQNSSMPKTPFSDYCGNSTCTCHKGGDKEEGKVNYMQIGGLVVCGHCNPERFSKGLREAEKTGFQCDCKCHFPSNEVKENPFSFSLPKGYEVKDTSTTPQKELPPATKGEGVDPNVLKELAEAPQNESEWEEDFDEMWKNKFNQPIDDPNNTAATSNFYWLASPRDVKSFIKKVEKQAEERAAKTYEEEIQIRIKVTRQSTLAEIIEKLEGIKVVDHDFNGSCNYNDGGEEHKECRFPYNPGIENPTGKQCLYLREEHLLQAIEIIKLKDNGNRI